MRGSRRGGAAVVASALALVLSGCAAPGSAMTQVGVTGRVVDAVGAPVAGEQIELTLPAGYGLAGLDAVMFEPSAYGHHRMSANLVTDSDGRFSWRFPQTTYSVTFLLIPPLGARPRNPPPPLIGLRTAAMAPDWLLVRADGESVECRRLDYESKTVAEGPDEHVTGSASLVDPPETEEATQGIRGWRLDLTIRRD